MGTIKALHAVLLQLIRPDMGAKEVCTLSLTGASNSNFCQKVWPWRKRVCTKAVVGAAPLSKATCGRGTATARGLVASEAEGETAARLIRVPMRAATRAATRALACVCLSLRGLVCVGFRCLHVAPNLCPLFFTSSSLVAG